MKPAHINEPKIAAVVVTFNRPDELKGCIAALRAQTRPADEIIVVVNGSTDGTRAWLETQPDLRVLYQENRGAAGGYARGMLDAVARDFDWLWCLDDDAHPTPTALEMLCRAIGARPDARVFNSLCVARDDDAHFAVGALCVRTDADNYLSGQYVSARADLAPFTDADGIVDSIGGCMWHGILIQRAIVEQVGVPAEEFFSYGEEVEYGLRMMRAGFHILMVTKSVVRHPALSYTAVRFWGRSKSFQILNLRLRYLATRNGIWVHRLYYTQNIWLYAARRLAGAWLVDLFLAPQRSLRERFVFARAGLRGVYDGLRVPPPDVQAVTRIS